MYPVMYVPPRPSSQAATWSLILGILGVLFGWCVFGIPSIIAVILGHIGLAETRDGQMEGRGMAVTGLVLGYVAAVPAALVFVFLVLGGIAGTST